MSMFQKSVLNKYLNNLNRDEIEKAFQTFSSIFIPEKIKNIKNSKEEEYQDGFLVDLFVNIMGYTKSPDPGFNLRREYKNKGDAKKADGAIVKDGKAVAVIELKSTKTKDMESITAQAFGYKNKQPDCRYIITSNFHKLRFYVENAIEYEEFDLFNLDKEAFERLYLLLHKNTLFSDIPLALKEESICHEEEVSKKLYQDYSAFKNRLFENLVKNNPKQNKLTLFKKTQKLIDRFLFILFAEDKGLLPPNLINQVIERFEKLDELDAYQPLYDIYKQYFGYINKGHSVENKPSDNIPAYNGGLFYPDEILDNLKIDDTVLIGDLKGLSSYDFLTEVDVNILGHIFEHSLSEIEKVTAEIEGQTIDKTKSKRKKDGVFYTPKYITQYIVESTIGSRCKDKRQELELVDIELDDSYHTKKGLSKKGKLLYQKLEDYKTWLLSLKILDPACGSGAFLNQALNFLIKEHEFIMENQTELQKGQVSIFDIDIAVLENNIFGVDINEESVEIARLSLWLRTAQKGRKLSVLSNNIKCGNSLIDSKKVAGDKAFNWKKEFPEIMENGGFDVVIGNPPYVQLQSMGEMSDNLKNCKYETFDKGADIYCLFTERGYNLLKKGGVQSFIMPNKWMLVKYGNPLRRFLSKTGMTQILNFGDIQFFEEATTYVCIFITQKSKPKDSIKVLSLNQKSYKGDFLSEVNASLYDTPSSKFGEKEWSIQPLGHSEILEKMEAGIELKDMPISMFRGIVTGYNDAFYIDEETRQALIEKDAKSEELIKSMVRGRDITAYGLTGGEYLICTFPSLKLDIENYPAIKEHLLTFGYDRLKQTGEKGSRKKTSGKWFETQDSIKYHEHFSKPKVVFPNMTSVFPFMYDVDETLSNQKGFILTTEEDSVSLLFLTAVFNSSLAKLWIWYNCPELQGGTREISKIYFEHFPVPGADEEQTEILVKYAEERTQLTSNLQTLVTKFQRTIQREFSIKKLQNKLLNWHSLNYKEFLAELRKKKVKLELDDKETWEDHFIKRYKEAQTIKNSIRLTDQKINQMVYALYGLTEEEVTIVEAG